MLSEKGAGMEVRIWVYTCVGRPRRWPTETQTRQLSRSILQSLTEAETSHLILRTSGIAISADCPVSCGAGRRPKLYHVMLWAVNVEDTRDADV